MKHLVRNLGGLFLSLLLIAVAFGHYSRNYTISNAAEKLAHDLKYPYGITLPPSVKATHGYCFGSIDRGDLFRATASPEDIHKIERNLQAQFTPSTTFKLDISSDASRTPVGFDQNGRHPRWWTPWELKKTKVYYISKETIVAGMGAWICLSEEEGLIFIAVFDS